LLAGQRERCQEHLERRDTPRQNELLVGAVSLAARIRLSVELRASLVRRGDSPNPAEAERDKDPSSNRQTASAENCDPENRKGQSEDPDAQREQECHRSQQNTVETAISVGRKTFLRTFLIPTE
jgi:hypothetical protein